MKDILSRRPMLALPFTILTERDTVRLVAGEDFRYTLTGPSLDQWLPGFLADLNGGLPVQTALTKLPELSRGPALVLVERLYGERVLVNGPASAAHHTARYRLDVQGSGGLVGRLRATGEIDTSLPVLSILCQDRLAYHEALEFNRRGLSGKTPWLWTSYGALHRAYVSPVFLPDAGPCLACLIEHFRRLSPVPEIYDSLAQHAEKGGQIEPATFPGQGLEILVSVVEWKVELLGMPNPPAALYRLHVVEAESMEISTHRVFKDPECPQCSR